MSTAPQLTATRAGRAVVVTLEGEIDRVSAPQIRAAIEAAVDDDALGVVCDLSAVTYLDSSGVGLVHGLARALRSQGRRLVLVRPSRRTPVEVLELTGVGEIAPLHDDLATALAGF